MTSAINTLVKYNVLRQGSNVKATYQATRIDYLKMSKIDYFEVMGIKTEGSKVKWLLLSRTDGYKVKATPGSILKIDGMDIPRVLESHDLKIEEDILKTSKRKYKHTNYLGKEVDYTEITYTFVSGKNEKVRFDENGEKIRRGRKRKHFPEKKV